MQELWLVRHGPTSATQARRFGADEALLPGAAPLAARLADELPGGARALSSPARRCRETAAAAGLAPTVAAALDQVDIGAWRGRSWAEVHDEDPARMATWLSDPDATPHGGESLAAMVDRVGAWLGALSAEPVVTVVAVTHSEVVRAAVLAALELPHRVFWALTVDPLSITRLRHHDGRFTLAGLNRTAAP